MANEFDPRLIEIKLTDKQGKIFTFREDLAITARGTITQSFIKSSAIVRIANINAQDRTVLSSEFAPFEWARTPGKTGNISISAGRESTGLSLIFQGVIQESSISQPPDMWIEFQVLGQNEVIPSIINRNFGQNATVKTIASQVASDLDATLVFNVKDNKKVPNQYIRGDVNAELKMLTELGDYDVSYHNSILIVKDRGEPAIAGAAATQINVNTGMIGLPTLNNAGGVTVEFLVRPSIFPGTLIDIASVLVPTAGKSCIVTNLSFNISSRDQPFTMTAYCTPAGQIDPTAGKGS